MVELVVTVFTLTLVFDKLAHHTFMLCSATVLWSLQKTWYRQGYTLVVLPPPEVTVCVCDSK